MKQEKKSQSLQILIFVADKCVRAFVDDLSYPIYIEVRRYSLKNLCKYVNFLQVENSCKIIIFISYIFSRVQRAAAGHVTAIRFQAVMFCSWQQLLQLQLKVMIFPTAVKYAFCVNKTINNNNAFVCGMNKKNKPKQQPRCLSSCTNHRRLGICHITIILSLYV